MVFTLELPHMQFTSQKNHTNTRKMEPQIQSLPVQSSQDQNILKDLSPLLDFLPEVSPVNEYTASNQKQVLQEIARQLLVTGTAQPIMIEQLERVLFVESATSMLMADVQDYADLGHVLQNLKALHVSIIATFMPYPAYHVQARKWIDDFFKKNPVYCRWLEACEEAAQNSGSRSTSASPISLTPSYSP